MQCIPYDEKFKDPLWYARIEKDGFKGIVEDVERGKESREILYLVRYSDGVEEHLTGSQVIEFVGLARLAASNTEPDHVSKKKPAGIYRGKAKAMPAMQKSIAKNVAKANGKATPKRAVFKKPAWR